MLKPILRLITGSKPPLAAETKRPLRMQTVYGGAGSHLLFSPNVAINETAISSIPRSQTILDRQKEILRKDGKYTSIEEITLPKDRILIGLTRHSKVLLNSVFVSSEDAPYTEKWPWLKSEAESRNCNIAYLKTTQDVQCLKLTEASAPGLPPICSYLVDHRMLVLEASRGLLLRSDARQVEQPNLKV